MGGYEPQFYYWEIVIMIRKILMVSIAVFFNYDIQIQSLLATLLCVMALCVHALGCPYVTDAMDGLELLSLFGSFCTYFFGQFLFTPSVSSAGRAIVSFIIVFVNLAVMAAIFALIVGQGVGIVGKIGKKLRRVCCCQPNQTSPQNQQKVVGTGDQPSYVLQQSQSQVSIEYDTNSRRKRKKKARIDETMAYDQDDEDEYGNVDYSNVDYSNNMPDVLPPQPNQEVKLQSNLLGNNDNDDVALKADDYAMNVDNKVVVEENRYEQPQDKEQFDAIDQYEYNPNQDTDESEDQPIL